MNGSRVVLLCNNADREGEGEGEGGRGGHGCCIRCNSISFGSSIRVLIVLCRERKVCFVVHRRAIRLYCCVHGQTVAQESFLGKRATRTSHSTT